MKYIVAISILILLCISILINIFPIDNQIDYCLDKGYCWDYVRNRCEEFDQGNCVKDEFDCLDRRGQWDNIKHYCNFKKVE